MNRVAVVSPESHDSQVEMLQEYDVVMVVGMQKMEMLSSWIIRFLYKLIRQINTVYQ